MPLARRRRHTHPISARRRRIAASLALALAISAPSRFGEPLLANIVAVVAVTPHGASAGVSVQITGTGFDPAAAGNSVTLAPPTGPAVTVAPEAIVTLDSTKGLRRLGIRVPAGFPVGPASVRVTNLI